MKIITRQILADNVLKEWQKTYYINGKWRYNDVGMDKLETYRNLLSLGNNPKPDAIDVVIGNTSWTELRCDECDEYVEKVVRVGGDIDNGSASADLCEECVIKLSQVLKDNEL